MTEQTNKKPLAPGIHYQGREALVPAVPPCLLPKAANSLARNNGRAHRLWLLGTTGAVHQSSYEERFQLKPGTGSHLPRLSVT